MRESDLQQAIVRWAKTLVTKYPELLWLHAIANGGKRDSREAQSLKEQGLVAGILDMHLPVARGGYHGAMIENKRPGGKCLPPSKEQAEYIEFLTNQGYATLVSNSFDEVKQFLVDYLEGKIMRQDEKPGL